MNRVQFLSRIGLVFTCVSAMIVGTARAATINGNQDVGTGAVMTFTDTSGQTLTKNAAWVYDWNDADGNGATGDAISPGGLDLGTVKISTANGTNITLSLNGGSITATGASTNTLGLATTRSGGNTGNVTITNVGDVTVGTIDTHSDGDRIAGNVAIGASGSRAGTISIGQINVSERGGGGGGGGGLYSGAVTIYSSGAVSITSGIDLRARYVGPGVLVDHVGQFNSGIINDSADMGLSVTFATSALTFNGGNKGGSFTAPQILATSVGFKSASVTIMNYSGVSVVPGSGKAIDVSGTAYGTSASRFSQITVTNIGSGGVTLGDLANYGTAGNAYSGDVVIGNIAGGGLAAGNIDTSNGTSSGGRAGGNVTIYGLTGDVVIGSVSTTANRTDAGYQTGDLRIGYRVTATDGAGYPTADALDPVSGDITVAGTIDLNSATANTYDGRVKLATTGREITLGSLDLSKVKYAVLAPGSKCIVKGDLLGFSTNVTTQTQLRMPVGKRMIYYPGLTNNAYLAGGKYALASVDGTPAAGGVLMPYASPGTVITLK